MAKVKLTHLASPADQRKYNVVKSKGDPKRAHEGLASAPVAMTPKRQVRAKGEPATAYAGVAPHDQQRKYSAKPRS